MAYRNKETCLAEAERLGIDVSGMSWSELQKAVSNGLKNEIKDKQPEKIKKPKEKTVDQYDQRRLQAIKEAEMIKPYIGKTVVLAPELKSERYRLIKYDEVLGNEIEVEERQFDIDRNTDMLYDKSGGKVDYDNTVDQYHDYTTGTYRIKNRSDRKVVAMSSVPKENAGMIFRPGIDYATVVTWNGRAGYLWKHWRYPNVKALLQAAGDEYYQKYKGRFKDEPNVWYAAGKMLVCDPYLVHKTLRDIENDEKQRRAEEKARLRELGLNENYEDMYKW